MLSIAKAWTSCLLPFPLQAFTVIAEVGTLNREKGAESGRVSERWGDVEMDGRRNQTKLCFEILIP